MRWYLEAVAEPNRDWRLAIQPFPFVIGRDEECNLQLTDNLISRLHAEIRISGDHLWIRDLKSTNGTYVNHRRIEQAELLEMGDIISIGNFRFCVGHLKPANGFLTEETYSIDITENFSSMAILEPKFRALLRGREVVPHFQPVLRFSDREIQGYEILGRIADRELPADPSELLEMAELIGCSSELSALFREVGLQIGRNLPGSKLLFVNTTPLEISRMDSFLASLKRIVHLAPSKKIVLEINEKTAAENDEMPQLRRALEELDIGLAFDDFGIGQTRLVDLAKVPPDFLKFDQSLIRQIHLAPKRLHQMVSTFVKAGRDLGIATLAEGIESVEEADTCRQLGFDMAQGFYFGRPMSITETLRSARTR